jgi:hypothetical protein
MSDHDTGPAQPAGGGDRRGGKPQHGSSAYAIEFSGEGQGAKDGADAEEYKMVDLGHRDWTMVFYGVGAYLSYLALGAIFYSFILPEKWSVTVAIYFATTTFTTVGYGDYYPTHDGSKLFTCLFAFLGVSLIGGALGFVATSLLDQEAQKNKFAAKPPPTPAASILAAAKKEGAVNAYAALLWRRLKRLLKGHIMQAGLLSLALILGGSAVIAEIEGFTFLDSFYLCCITIFTVGFGDIHPVSEAGYLFFIVYIPIGAMVTANFMQSLAAVPIEQRRRRLEHLVLTQFGSHLDTGELQALTGDTGGRTLNKDQFALRMLVKMNRCSDADIEESYAQFDRLDKSGDGTLDMDDVSDAADSEGARALKHASTMPSLGKVIGAVPLPHLAAPRLPGAKVAPT